MTIAEMIGTHPRPSGDREALTRCIEECYRCATACTSCADACLAEQDVNDLIQCIRLDLDCADLCEATGRILLRQTAADPAVLRAAADACATACRACAAECERHAHHHEHCRVCAEACRRCEQACNDLLLSIG
jgi:hypothetical protein